ncbi:hypothetical protein MRX96_026912 [Rhipicephalus microplus]
MQEILLRTVAELSSSLPHGAAAAKKVRRERAGLAHLRAFGEKWRVIKAGARDICACARVCNFARRNQAPPPRRRRADGCRAMQARTRIQTAAEHLDNSCRKSTVSSIVFLLSFAAFIFHTSLRGV